MNARTLVLAPALLALALHTGRARADEATPGTAEMREAETRFSEGLQLYSQGSINEARVKLVQAYAVLGRTNILWNLAVAEFYSSRFLESIRHMRLFVKSPDADPTDVALAKKQFLPELERHTARLDVKAASGAAIVVDGEELGPSPLDRPVDVLPGRHLVLARTTGGNATASVSVRAGQSFAVNLASAEGTTAGGAAPPAEEPARSTEAEGSSSGARTVTVIALGAGALVAGGVGAGALLASSSAADDASTLTSKLGGDRSACVGGANPDCASLREANEERDRFAGLATGMFIGAGALALGAVVTYFLWPAGAAKPARASLSPTRGGLSTTVTVRF